MTAPTETVRKAHCGMCGGERNCEIRGRWGQSGGDQHFQWHTDWYILECRGCEHVFVQTASTNSEDIDHYYNEAGEWDQIHPETTAYWPALGARKRPDWFGPSGAEVPNLGSLDAALSELYGALDADLSFLSGIGIRTCFDVASELLGADPRLNFNQKLDALVQGGHIGAVDRGRLAALVDAGSASAHRGWKPSNSDLNTMMDVLEHFIAQAFVEPHRRKQLDEKVGKLAVPRRQKPASQEKVAAPAIEVGHSSNPAQLAETSVPVIGSE